MKSFSIGQLRLKNPLLLAPMVDVTDLPYRLICREAGAAMAYIEMLNTGAILHENKKTKNLMQNSKEDKPLGIQITGPSVRDFKKVIPLLQNKGYDLVDINCGCPSIRTLDNKSGAHLLKTPAKIVSYIKALKDAGITTTAKIRLGYKNNNVIKIAKEIEKAGADALTIHARLAWHSYKVPADWSWIAKVKKNIGIPVIGNGDIFLGATAAQMLEIADGAMIARGALGDPSIFSRILYYLKTGKEKPFDFKENISYFKKYLHYAEKYKMIDVQRIKYVGSNFIKGFHGAAKLRNQFTQLKTFYDVKGVVGSMKDNTHEL